MNNYDLHVLPSSLWVMYMCKWEGVVHTYCYSTGRKLPFVFATHHVSSSVPIQWHINIHVLVLCVLSAKVHLYIHVPLLQSVLLKHP